MTLAATQIIELSEPPESRVALSTPNGDVPVAVLSVDGLVGRLAAMSAGPELSTVCYINAHVFNLAWGDRALLAALRSCTLVWPDGVSGRAACRLAGAHPPERFGGYYFFEKFNRALAAAGRSQFLLGGREESVAQAAVTLRKRFAPSLVAGWHHGHFADADELTVIERINASGADVLTVGMGSPRQELWIARNAARLRPRLLWAVGALFDFVSGRERVAPRPVRAVALEWAWRLLQNPAGKWRRYVLGNPLFLWRMLRRRPRLLGRGDNGTGLA